MARTSSFLVILRIGLENIDQVHNLIRMICDLTGNDKMCDCHDSDKFACPFSQVHGESTVAAIEVTIKGL